MMVRALLTMRAQLPEFGKEHGADIDRLLRAFRRHICAMCGLVHDTEGREKLSGARGSKSALMEGTDHFADASWALC